MYICFAHITKSMYYAHNFSIISRLLNYTTEFPHQNKLFNMIFLEFFLNFKRLKLYMEDKYTNVILAYDSVELGFVKHNY